MYLVISSVEQFVQMLELYAFQMRLTRMMKKKMMVKRPLGGSLTRNQAMTLDARLLLRFLGGKTYLWPMPVTLDASSVVTGRYVLNKKLHLHEI